MEITESILTSIKKLLGIDAEYKHFDPISSCTSIVCFRF